MRKTSHKSQRINGEVQKELSRIIRMELKDPRINPMTSVTDVMVTQDLKYCKAYISVLGDAESGAETLKGLEQASGFIRRELARTINLRNTPELTFVLDTSIEYGNYMSKRIDEVIKEDQMKKSELLNLIEDAKTIGIFGHIRPDGDCVGSCLGLYNYIQDNYDAEVTVYLEKIPDKFSFLKGADAICHEPESRVLDLAISLDCGDRDRHGSFYELFGMAKKSACLDHHRSNQGFGDYYYCDADASSASEVLFRHIDPENISLACAECLYLGIVHDTGVFKYSACTKDTMQVAGELLAHGVDAQKIIDDTFYRVSYKQNLLMGQAMVNAKLALSGQVVYTFVTKEMFDTFGCGKEETDGIVDRIRVIDGVEVAIFVYQLGDAMKVSLRSIRKVNVSKIAVAYGGGGHIRAAGFEVTGDFDTVVADIIKMIEEQL